MTVVQVQSCPARGRGRGRGDRKGGGRLSVCQGRSSLTPPPPTQPPHSLPLLSRPRYTLSTQHLTLCALVGASRSN
eukprot:scaffold16555_cov130-Isochrysis_galbana.AAC.1